MNLLNIMITKSEKMRRVRSGSVTDQEKNERLLNKFSANRDLLKEKYETGNMVELVNWLYTNE
jgi:signal recognition particle GTPase